MDDGYEQLVGMVTLNHDRYKTYFTQFIALQFGLFIAMSTQFNDLLVFFCAVGLAVCVVWTLVQWKIQQDIKGTWDAIETYENGSSHLRAKLSSVKKRKPEASSTMLAVPALFGVVYAGIIVSKVC